MKHLVVLIFLEIELIKIRMRHLLIHNINIGNELLFKLLYLFIFTNGYIMEIILRSQISNVSKIFQKKVLVVPIYKNSVQQPNKYTFENFTEGAKTILL